MTTTEIAAFHKHFLAAEGDLAFREKLVRDLLESLRVQKPSLDLPVAQHWIPNHAFVSEKEAADTSLLYSGIDIAAYRAEAMIENQSIAQAGQQDGISRLRLKDWNLWRWLSTSVLHPDLCSDLWVLDEVILDDILDYDSSRLTLLKNVREEFAIHLKRQEASLIKKIVFPLHTEDHVSCVVVFLDYKSGILDVAHFDPYVNSKQGKQYGHNLVQHGLIDEQQVMTEPFKEFLLDLAKVVNMKMDAKFHDCAYIKTQGPTSETDFSSKSSSTACGNITLNVHFLSPVCMLMAIYVLLWFSSSQSPWERSFHLPFNGNDLKAIRSVSAYHIAYGPISALNTASAEHNAKIAHCPVKFFVNTHQQIDYAHFLHQSFDWSVLGPVFVQFGTKNNWPRLVDNSANIRAALSDLLRQWENAKVTCANRILLDANRADLVKEYSQHAVTRDPHDWLSNLVAKPHGNGVNTKPLPQELFKHPNFLKFVASNEQFRTKYKEIYSHASNTGNAMIQHLAGLLKHEHGKRTDNREVRLPAGWWMLDVTGPTHGWIHIPT